MGGEVGEEAEKECQTADEVEQFWERVSFRLCPGEWVTKTEWKESSQKVR